MPSEERAPRPLTPGAGFALGLITMGLICFALVAAWNHMWL